MLLVHGLTLESSMTDSEMQTVEAGLENAKENGVKIIVVPSLVRQIHPIHDVRAVYDLIKILQHEKPDVVPRPDY